MTVTILEGTDAPAKAPDPAPPRPAGQLPSKSRFFATITAKGRTYSAWESVTVQVPFKGTRTFSFTPAEGSYGRSFADLKLQPGDAVVVRLGGKLVISGFVTTRAPAYDAESHQLVISGRSKADDVGKSSVDIKPGTLDGNTFEQAARKACQPHNVGISLKNPPPIASKPFKSLMLQFGETGGEFISRIATLRGMFIRDDENGNVVAGCGEPGAAPVAQLVEGKNILRASGIIEDDSAFGKFQTVSQTPGPGEDAPPRWHSATATDSNARQNLQRLQIAEGPLESDELATRNNFEIANALWAQVQVAITVVGWFRPDGSLWDAGDNIAVDSPMIFPTADGRYDKLAVQTVTFSQDSQNGTTTTLSLTLANALTSIPSAGLSDLGGTGDAGNAKGGPEPSSAPDSPDYLTT